jgi:uncharacterized protein
VTPVLKPDGRVWLFRGSFLAPSAPRGATDERSPAIDGVDFTRYSEGEESEAQALQLRFCARFSSSEAFMLGWFRALMPKEERFFDLFTRHAEVTLAAARALRALLRGDDDVLRCCREITKRENEADEITREVMTALRKTFITPLDRGDIKDLITSMDDSIDQMNQTAKVITLFELRSFEPPMQDMGDVIVEAAKLMVEAVPLLSSLGRHSARLNSLTEEVIRLEEQADQLHDQGRRQLFLNEKDAIAFVIGTEVYEHLETVVDRFEDVANEISAIVIENV